MDEINYLGEKSIHYFKLLCFYLETEIKNSGGKTLEDINTLIIVKINLAKISSKLIYKDNKKTLQLMKNGLILYQEAYNVINNIINNYSITDTLTNQYKLCEEMIHLLPIKIAKMENKQIK